MRKLSPISFLLLIALMYAPLAFGKSAKPKEVMNQIGPASWGQATTLIHTEQGTFAITENRARRGFHTKIIVGDGFRDLRIDENGDGNVDRWELAKGRLTLYASNPHRGHFISLQIKEAKENGMLTSSLLYDAKSQSYKLVGQSIQSYGVQRADALVVGAKCSITNPQRFNDFEALVNQIRLQGQLETEEAFSCRLKAMKPLFFDSSCTDNTKFKDSTNTMIDGLAKVLASATTKGIGKRETPRFLGCLERYGLAEHSARIQALVNQPYLAAENTLLKGNFTASEREQIEKIKPPQCELGQEIQARMKGPLASGVKLFKCAPPSGKFGPTERGSFISTRDSEQIVLSKTKDELPTITKTKAVNGYASTIFHELVHSSGVDDENLTREIEACCAPDDNDGVVVSKCNSLLAKTKIKEDAQLIQGALALGTYKESQTTVLYDLNQALGSGVQADIFMEQYTTYVGSRRSQDLEEMAKLKDSNGNLCSTGEVSKECTRLQASFIQTKWQQHTREFFSSKCEGLMASFDSIGDGSEKKALCGKFQTRFESMVTPVSINAENVALLQTYTNYQDADGHYENTENGDHVASEQLTNAGIQANDVTGAVGDSAGDAADAEAAQAERSGVLQPAASQSRGLPIPVQADKPERAVSSNIINTRASPISMGGSTTESRSDFVRGVRRSEYVVTNASSALAQAGSLGASAILPSALAAQRRSVPVARRQISIPARTIESALRAPAVAINYPALSLISNNSGGRLASALEQSQAGSLPALNSFQNGKAELPARSEAIEKLTPASGGKGATRTVRTQVSNTTIISSSSTSRSVSVSREGGSSRAAPRPDARLLGDFSAAQNFLTQDYSRVEPYLGQTQFSRELIDLNIQIKDRNSRIHGCRGGQCRQEYQYCSKTNRLTPPRGC